jgi:Flp pilus assembly protein TadG
MQQKPGQSLVEFALLLPLICLLLFGIIELSIILGVYVGLTNSAREAARSGSIYQEPNAITSASAVTTMDTNRRLSIATTITDTLTPMISPALLTTTVVFTPSTPLDRNLYRAGDQLNVHLRYTHQLFFGLFGRQAITLQANSTMRIEPGGAP